MECFFYQNNASSRAIPYPPINLAESNDITTPARPQKTAAFQKISLVLLEKSWKTIL
jgi:hypothetical protein